MILKEFAAERKWKFKFLLILIGLVVCTGSDLWVKAIVENKLRNVPENVSQYAFEKQFLKFDTEDKIIANAYEQNEDGSYQLKEKDSKKIHLIWKQIRRFGFDREVEVIKGGWYFVYETNEDIGFSILRWLDKYTNDTTKWILLVCLQGGGVLLILAYLLFVKETYMFIPLTVIVTGALGNVIDRIFRGYVVDFVMWIFKFIPHPLFNPWPIFNLADVYTVCGAISLLVILVIFDIKSRKLENK